jgi:predicted GIY-YIG superfamily endonuclease
MPAVLFTQLREETTKETEEYMKKTKEELIDSFLLHLKPLYGTRIPSKIEVLNATIDKPTPFELTSIPRFDGQDTESYREHHTAYQTITEAVQHYKAARECRTKSIVLVGAGGVGKTVDLRIAGLYCLSQGLSVMTTTLTGKRAAETAGEHIHVLFKIPINSELTVNQAAEIAFASLLKDPKKLMLLATLDILCLDELGQVDVFLLSVVELICRRIRHSAHFMGGILVISTMDLLQLKPVDGLPPIFSPSMICSFKYILYEMPLRTTDPDLKRIQQITRMTKKQLTENGSIKNEFYEKLKARCNFVSDIEHAPDGNDVVYCFARHEPCKTAEKKVIKKKINSLKLNCVPFLIKKATDWEETRTQINPTRARESTSKRLDILSRPSRELLFAPLMPYEVTYNDSKGGQFFHGQLCVLPESIPDQEHIDAWKDIEVLLAPVGCDSVPTQTLSDDLLLKNGWKRVRVAKEPTRKYNLGNNGLVGQREQYGLRHRICVTIHAIMGSTVSKLVTEVGTKEYNNIWEAAMVIVLLSRTRKPEDITFIGAEKETLNGLWHALLVGGRYIEIARMILDSLTDKKINQNHYYLDRNDLIFRQYITVFPPKGNTVVYMLVSLKDCTTIYTGCTSHLRRRLNEHNSASGGSKGTGGVHRTLNPWAVIAFVKGFRDKYDAMSFEGRWKTMVSNYEKLSVGTFSAEDRADLAENLIGDKPELTFVKCGKMQRQSSS